MTILHRAPDIEEHQEYNDIDQQNKCAHISHLWFITQRAHRIINFFVVDDTLSGHSSANLWAQIIQKRHFSLKKNVET